LLEGPSYFIFGMFLKISDIIYLLNLLMVIPILYTKFGN
jgi:hypothetical protein